MKRYLIILSLCLATQITFAQNKNIVRTGEKTYSVGAYGHPFGFERIIPGVSQNLLFWDWASCIAMCLNYGGLNVSQEQVMSLVNGTPEEPQGSPQDLMFAINKTTPTAWGKSSKVYCNTASVDADVLFDELSADRPLIVGTGSVGVEGRAYIVTAMTYNIKFNADGRQTGINPTTVTLRDPWPSALANRTILWSDFVILTASLYTIKVELKK